MKKCAECGKPESAHHEFEPEEPQDMPPGCKCEPESWGMPVKPICAAFVAGDVHEYCGTCEHDRACHAESEEVAR